MSSTTTTVVGRGEPKPVLPDSSGLLWAGVAELVLALTVVVIGVWFFRRRRSA